MLCSSAPARGAGRVRRPVDHARRRTTPPPATAGSAEITAANATRLRPVWTFSTGVLAGHEGQPLVVKNTMYVVTPWPNVLYAFDLTKEGYPLKWKYRPDVSPNAIGDRPAATWSTAARSTPTARSSTTCSTATPSRSTRRPGKELWKTQIADLDAGETTPMAPFVVKDRVIVGASGGEFGIYGWVKGLDLKTGKIVWTGAQHRPRRRDAGQARHLQAVLRQGHRPGRNELAGRRLEDRRRAGVGLDVLRPRARPGLLRRRQPVALQRRAAAGRQQVDRRACSRAGPATARWCGPTSSRRTTTGTTTPSPP